MRTMVLSVAAALVALAGAGCSEQPQVLTGQKIAAGAPAWDGARDEFVVEGWKTGDKASWEAQMRTRGDGQNDYKRISGS